MGCTRLALVVQEVVGEVVVEVEVCSADFEGVVALVGAAVGLAPEVVVVVEASLHPAVPAIHAFDPPSHRVHVSTLLDPRRGVVVVRWTSTGLSRPRPPSNRACRSNLCAKNRPCSSFKLNARSGEATRRISP